MKIEIWLTTAQYDRLPEDIQRLYYVTMLGSYRLIDYDNSK